MINPPLAFYPPAIKYKSAVITLVSRVGFEPTFFLVPNQVPYQTRRTRVKRTHMNAYNKAHSIPQSFDPHSLKEFYAYESVPNALYYNKYFLFT